jgi:peptidoglycan hydrolase FlgJ
MDVLNSTSLAPLLAQSSGSTGGKSIAALAANGDQQAVRDRVGEFVGGVFYGTLFRQMQESKLKGKYFHGGRGEEAFQGQLNLELAKKLGRAKNNPVTDRLTKSIEKHLGKESRDGFHEADAAAVGQTTEVGAVELIA